MKNLTTLFSLLIFTSLFLKAEVFTVSNNGLTPAQFNNLSEAQAAASPGDTLYIAGSPTNYGGISIVKPLTLIGAGYDANFLSSAYPSQLGTIILWRDDAAGTNASGSSIIGLSANSLVNTSGNNANHGIDNITVRNCAFLISSITPIVVYANESNPCSNWLIEHNLIRRIDATPANGNGDGAYVENFTIRNNVIVEDILGLKGNNNLITHNVFVKTPSQFNGGTLLSVQNAIISNNVFLGASPIGSGTTLNMFVNNIYGPFDWNQNSNTGLNNISVATAAEILFVNYPVTSGHDNSYDYHLQAGSPAIGMADDGSDIGIFGGVNPFPANFGGQPAGIPTVESLEIPDPAIGTDCLLEFNSTGQVNP